MGPARSRAPHATVSPVPVERGLGDVRGGVCPTPPVLTLEDRDPGFRAGHPNCFPMASEQEGKQPCGCAGLNFVPPERCGLVLTPESTRTRTTSSGSRVFAAELDEVGLGWVCPPSNGRCPYKERKGHTAAREGAAGRGQSDAATSPAGPGRGRRAPPPAPAGGPAGTLTADLQPAALGQSKLLLLQATQLVGLLGN